MGFGRAATDDSYPRYRSTHTIRVNKESLMAVQVQGIVAREKGAPVTLETIIVPDPGPGEARVKVLACGVCHTDLHYRQGAINDLSVKARWDIDFGTALLNPQMAGAMMFGQA